MILLQLQDSAWDSTEGIDYEDIEFSENPFLPIRQTLDLLYQHEEEVELPELCQEFFEQFAREKGEESAGVHSGHMLSQAGVPRWTA